MTANYIELTEHYDHRHSSGAVVEYNKGGKYPVPGHVAEAAIKSGAAKKIEKPADDDPALVSPPPRVSDHNKPLASRRTPPKVTRGGHEYGKTGNPELLPDPTDPEAVHEGTVTAAEAKQREKEAKADKGE